MSCITPFVAKSDFKIVVIKYDSSSISTHILSTTLPHSVLPSPSTLSYTRVVIQGSASSSCYHITVLPRRESPTIGSLAVTACLVMYAYLICAADSLMALGWHAGDPPQVQRLTVSFDSKVKELPALYPTAPL